MKRPTIHHASAPSPVQTISEFQKKTLTLIDAFKKVDSADRQSSDPVELLREYLELPHSTPIHSLITAMLSAADFNIGTYYNESQSGVPLIHASASYKNYKDYKLPWTETYNDRPVMFYQSRCLHVAVAVCYLTLCLRTDKQLCQQEVKTTSPRLHRNLRRIKRAEIPN